jgi:tRNA-Thr(GGU) m(6)t(6)A37 methyltransferase TsaA
MRGVYSRLQECVVSGTPVQRLCCYPRPHTRSLQKPAARSALTPYLGYGRIVEDVEEPVDGDPDPTVGALELVEVGSTPEERGYVAAELYAKDLVDRELAPHLHELPERPVPEGLRLLAVYDGQPVLGHSLALLDGGLRVRRHRLAPFVHEVRLDECRRLADNRDLEAALPPLRAIGRVESSLLDPVTAPKQGYEGAPPAWLVFHASVREGIRDLAIGDDVYVLTWLHLARRDVLAVHPRDDPRKPITGVFSTRSQDRPNPIGLHRVRILEIDGLRVLVEGLDAVDRTPIVDVKPVVRGGW